MGILNITPDSFSDGGDFLDTEKAIAHAERMLDEGAKIIDIGGESSRPKGKTYGEGASALSSDEELERILPVIEGLLMRRPDAILSVDTYKSVTAREVCKAGASMLNDITGLRFDEGLATVAAEFDVPLVVMHSAGLPGDLAHTNQYENVVDEVYRGLEQSAERARNAGVRPLVVDPGFGFGKSVTDNLRLIADVDRFRHLGYPVLLGLSRKSSIGEALSTGNEPAPISERLYGSLAGVAVAAMKGVSLVRCHDVGPMVELLRVIHRIDIAGLENG